MATAIPPTQWPEPDAPDVLFFRSSRDPPAWRRLRSWVAADPLAPVFAKKSQSRDPAAKFLNHFPSCHLPAPALLSCLVPCVLELPLPHPLFVRMYSGWHGLGLHKVSSCLLVVCCLLSAVAEEAAADEVGC